MDTTPIIHALWAAKKNCYLPVVTPAPQKSLQFALYTPDSTLISNRYQITEPDAGGKFFSHAKLDCVLLPLCGFDLQGHRLGSGGGYYDRTFAGKLQRDRPVLIGVGYQLQAVAALPADDWDVTLEGVLTETKILKF
jgi:5-formyltetrahydrofolate cyclo-ligase